jgi:hypothetical protein
MAFTSSQLFETASKISYSRAASACEVWHRIDGAKQQSLLQFANGLGYDIEACSMYLMNRLINY